MLWTMMSANPASARLALYNNAPPAMPTMAPAIVTEVGVSRSARAARAATMPSGRKKYTSANSSISYALKLSPLASANRTYFVRNTTSHSGDDTPKWRSGEA